MPTRDGFEIAGGTVTGRDHVTTGRNNQDAFCWSVTAAAVVAVVADGCGSGRHSEVGAQLGARVLTEALRSLALRFDAEPPDGLLEQARLEVLRQLRVLATGMGGDLRHVVSEYFLFTTLGFVVTPRSSVVFGIGDGVLAVNGQVRRLTAADNAPAYLGYGLASSTVFEEAPRFVVYDRRPPPDVRSILVGSDGAAEADVAEFWENDRYFANPFNVGRRLCQLNRTSTRADWDARRLETRPGALADDATVVVARPVRAAARPEEA